MASEGASHPVGVPSFADPDAGAFDAIFVHDFQTTAEVGAYAHERRIRQRLLFNIDAAVRRLAIHADDMRAVVSYDVILDAVRIVVGRGHIDFIETIAEEVAAIVLRHPRVREVRVKVEKLDVVEGSVGVEIVRRRSVEALGR
jgi:dihydroneopterin aldolase